MQDDSGSEPCRASMSARRDRKLHPPRRVSAPPDPGRPQQCDPPLPRRSCGVGTPVCRQADWHFEKKLAPLHTLTIVRATTKSDWNQACYGGHHCLASQLHNLAATPATYTVWNHVIAPCGVAAAVSFPYRWTKSKRFFKAAECQTCFTLTTQPVFVTDRKS